MFISYLFMIIAHKGTTNIRELITFLEFFLLYSLHAYIKSLENRMYKGFCAFLSLHKVPQKPT